MSRATVYRRTARTYFGLRISDCELQSRRIPLSPVRNPQSAIRIQPRSGLTLIEMLMATAITLLMMAAIVNLFATMTASISGRRAVIELNGQLRQVRQRLALDLAGCTVPPGDDGLMPWRQRPGEAIGYLEIVEGNRSDADPSGWLADSDNDGYPDPGGIDVTTSIIPSSQRLDPDSDRITDARALGDFDDILALTVRSLDVPFSGNYQLPSLDPGVQSEAGFPNPNVPRHWRTVAFNSNLAEVVWYALETRPDDPSTPLPQDESEGREPGMRRIFRRVLLVAPWLADDVDNMRAYSVGLNEFVQFNDLSVRRDAASTNIELNTLADLTRREYRYGRGGGSSFPFPFEFGRLSDDPKYLVLNDALAFDVRVYEPGAPLYSVAGVVVDPNDPAWQTAVGSTPIGFGAYCDLGWNDAGAYDFTAIAGSPPTLFQRERQAGWHPVFAAANPDRYRGTPAVYDTWTWHYENDGVDQYNDYYVDLARNGIDDEIPANTGYYLNGLPYANGVDDVAERETSPPYPVPLRGVKVLLRTYERDARQVREVSVTNSFVP